MTKYSLKHFAQFAEAHPFWKALKVIHITGTNGKTSTALLIANMLQMKGYKVGLFTSPHLDPLAGISVNNEKMPSSYYAQIITKYQTEMVDISPFERLTFTALSYFTEQAVDYAVIEVGLGGIDDATNIVDGIINVITSIALDHVDQLGTTLEEIATAKAGIIKGGWVITGELPMSCYDIINAKAKAVQATHLMTIKKSRKYQDWNFDIAVLTARLLVDLSDEEIEQARQSFFNPGRYEMIKKDPFVLLDGAHNVEGLEALITHLNLDFIPPFTFIFSCFSDKDYRTMIKIIESTHNKIVLCQFPHPRAVDLDVLDPNHQYPRLKISQLKEYLTGNDFYVITGSLNFVQQVRELLCPPEK